MGNMHMSAAILAQFKPFAVAFVLLGAGCVWWVHWRRKT